MLKDLKIVVAYADCSNDKLGNHPWNDSINKKWIRIRKAVQQQAASKILIKKTPIAQKTWVHEDILELINKWRKYKNSKDNFGNRTIKYNQ